MNDLNEMKQEIEQQQEDLRFQHDLIRKIEIMQKIEELMHSDIPYFQLLAEALAKRELKIAPKTPKLGYEMAKEYKIILEKSYKSPEYQEWLELKKLINDEDFIFMNTHYDCCSNGYFYRQS